MKSALRLALLSMLTSTPTYSHEVEAGSVLICDTQEQVERFVQLFDGDRQLAINAVNVETQDLNACAVVDVKYVTGAPIGVARNSSFAFEITPVVVIGTATVRGYRPTKPSLYLSPMILKEFAV